MLIPHSDNRKLIRTEALLEQDSDIGTGAVQDQIAVPHNEVWHVTGMTWLLAAAGVMGEIWILPPWLHPVMNGRAYLEDWATQYGSIEQEAWLPSGSIIRTNSTAAKSIQLDVRGEKYIFEDTQ
jgi:hypothetical protein